MSLNFSYIPVQFMGVIILFEDKTYNKINGIIKIIRDDKRLILNERARYIYYACRDILITDLANEVLVELEKKPVIDENESELKNEPVEDILFDDWGNA